MADLRHILDITPWDKSGNSFMGLKRNQAKYLATFLIIIGLLLADPPFSIIPSDILDLFVAGLLFKYLNPFAWSFELILLLTYTVLAWSIFFLGIWIYPYNTDSLLNGYINKFQNALKKALRNPIIIGFGLIMFYLIFRLYKGILEGNNYVIDMSGLQFLIVEPTEATLIFVAIIVGLMLLLRKK